jgi:hypothetical protein
MTLLRNTCLVLLSALLCASCATTDIDPPEQRVLFVGNSQLYVGNMPAVFAALASANGHPVVSDMIVRGGASLADRVADGSIAAALAEHEYAALVVQERGGTLLCIFGPEDCAASTQALAAIAGIAREQGVPMQLLGSAQSLPAASRALVEAEGLAAKAAGIPYVEVSETLRRLRERAPGLAWLHSDGSHPGKDLTLLDAMLVYRALYGSLPAARELTVNAPVYGTQSGLDAELRAATAPAPRPGTRRQVSYPAATFEVLADGLGPILDP